MCSEGEGTARRLESARQGRRERNSESIGLLGSGGVLSTTNVSYPTAWHGAFTERITEAFPECVPRESSKGEIAAFSNGPDYRHAWRVGMGSPDPKMRGSSGSDYRHAWRAGMRSPDPKMRGKEEIIP